MDPAANRFESLVQPHLERAYRLAFLITHHPAAAEDALQEALLRAYRAVGRLQPDRPFYPWFARIVVREAMRQARRGRPAIGLPPPEAPTPEGMVLHRERQAEIWQAIQSLRPIHRTVVVLRYYEQLSEAEMAAVLGVSPGTVKSRLHHARAELERRLARVERRLARLERRTAGSGAPWPRWLSARRDGNG